MNYWDILLAQKLKKPDPLPDNAYLLEQATGDVITLTDAAALPMPTATTNLTTIQDLHGYSNPWVGGAGKNLLPMTVEGIKSANTTGTWSGNVYTINTGTFELLTDSANNIIGINCNITVTGTTSILNLYSGDCSIFSNCILNGGKTSSAFIRLNSGGTIIDSRGADANIGTLSTTGEIYIALYGSYSGTFYPMIRLSTVTDGTFAPYTNIAPISGYDSASLTILDDSTKKQYFDGLLNGTYGFVDLGDLDWNLADGYNNTFICMSIPNGAISNTNKISDKYTLYQGDLSNMPNGTFRVAGGISGIYIKDTNYTNATIFKNAVKGVLIYELATPTTPTITSEQYATLTKAFNGQGVILSFENTIYSGVLDWVSGVLTVDKGMDNLGALTWTKWTYNNSFTATISNSKLANDNFICSNYAGVTHNSQADLVNGKCCFNNSNGFYIKDDNYASSDATTFKNAMDGVQLLYELNTPITYQLTPTQLKTLQGYNTIYTDIGNITLQYFGKGVNA